MKLWQLRWVCCCIVIHSQMVVHHLLQREMEFRAVWRQGAMRECLEVKQACITPPLCILRLTFETPQLFSILLCWHIRFHRFPSLRKLVRLTHTTVVSVAEIVPEGKSIAHRIIPRHMMEPKDKVLRTSAHIII